MGCHGSKPLIYVLISFTHSVTKAGVQVGPLGRFRTPSAPQRGSLVTSQPNTAEEFLYRVTTAFTYSLKVVLIFGTLKNCVHPAGVNVLTPRDEEYKDTYVIVVLATKVDGVHVHPEYTFSGFDRT